MARKLKTYQTSLGFFDWPSRHKGGFGRVGALIAILSTSTPPRSLRMQQRCDLATAKAKAVGDLGSRAFSHAARSA
jgi:hypothetical protein